MFKEKVIIVLLVAFIVIGAIMERNQKTISDFYQKVLDK